MPTELNHDWSWPTLNLSFFLLQTKATVKFPVQMYKSYLQYSAITLFQKSKQEIYNT